MGCRICSAKSCVQRIVRTKEDRSGRTHRMAVTSRDLQSLQYTVGDILYGIIRDFFLT
jgi:hypothetical protein